MARRAGGLYAGDCTVLDLPAGSKAVRVSVLVVARRLRALSSAASRSVIDGSPPPGGIKAELEELVAPVEDVGVEVVTALSSDETGVVDMIRLDKESPAVAARGKCPREMTACTCAEKSCCGKSKRRAPPMPCTRRLTLFNWIKLHCTH